MDARHVGRLPTPKQPHAEKQQAAKMAQWREAAYKIHRQFTMEGQRIGWGFWHELYSYVHDSVKPLGLDTTEFRQIHDNFSVFNNTENFFLVDEATWQTTPDVFHFSFGNDC